PAAVLSAFKMGTWGQPENQTEDKTGGARRSKIAKQRKTGTNRKARGKTAAPHAPAKTQTKVCVKGGSAETNRQAMAHEENYTRQASPAESEKKTAAGTPASTPDGTPGDPAAPDTVPSARLTKIGRNDRDAGALRASDPAPTSDPAPASDPAIVQNRSAIGGLPGPSNEEFQSWITRVRILNQNEAEHPGAKAKKMTTAPDNAANPGITGLSSQTEISKTSENSTTTPGSAALTRSIPASASTKAVQSSRDWSETAKKALDEMLVTMPENQSAGWSAPYAHQSPIALPPVKTVLPLYAKVLLPVMGLALSAYPIYFAMQKGWVPDLFGDAPIEIASQAPRAGQTPAPLSNRSRSTTDVVRGGFELGPRAPTAPSVAAPKPLPAPVAPPNIARATLLRPKTALVAAKPVQAATPAAVGWTTSVSGANAASVPINIENVVAVGPKTVPVKPVARARPAFQARAQFPAAKGQNTALAPRANRNKFANNSIELPNDVRSVGGPVIMLQPSAVRRPGAVLTANPLTGQLAPTGLPAPANRAASARLASINPVQPVAIAPSRQIIARSSVGAAPVENTEALLTRGTQMLKLGDIVSARLFFELAAKGGDPTGALAAGRTYDPLYLSRLGVRGIKADPARALNWYRTARQGGNAASSADILRLESQAGR
ncbi:MAG: hypothetical protein ACTSY1_04260, partial [Alphaproteobacteria bacterium]